MTKPWLVACASNSNSGNNRQIIIVWQLTPRKKRRRCLRPRFLVSKKFQIAKRNLQPRLKLKLWLTKNAIGKEIEKNQEVANKLKGIIGGLTEILIGAIGLLVVVQVVFGAGDGVIDIIGNITGVVNGFIGGDASLASLVALLIVLGVLSKK